MIVVDAPAEGASVPANVSLAGWALDLASEFGTGVDRVEVYLDGPRGSGTLVGVATYGLPRADVGMARRSTRYNAAGWSLDAQLPPGPRVLYIHAHQEGQSEDAGWSTPLAVSLHVEGSAVAAPTGRTPLGGAPPVPPAVNPSVGRGPVSADCQTADRDSGRCLVRVGRPANGQNPTTAVQPGSWTVIGSATRGEGSGNPLQGEISLTGGSLAASGLTYGTSLEPTTASARPTAGPTAPSGAPGTTGSAPATMAGAPSATGGTPAVSTGALAASSVAPAASTGMASGTGGAPSAAPPAAISLTATQSGRGQFTLNWNQLGGASYEILRCPSMGSATLACTLLARVQSSSYVLTLAEGVYMVRAVGAQGEPRGESNRLQLCCRG